jgi:translation elongation factor aEF-1 beta
MGTAAIQIKIMPDSPGANLDEIDRKAKEIIQKHEGRNPESKMEPVAFGLNAIIILFARDEEESTDELLDELSELPNVSSAVITDFRRTIG